MLKRRGFNLTKWGSNENDVISAFNSEDRAKGLQSLNFQENTLLKERVLGLNWNQETDELQIAAKTKDAVFTKRGLLSYICTLYDPLGIVCPYILIAKALFQQVCRRKAGWDDVLTEEEAKVFKKWLSVLESAKNIRIERPLPGSTGSRMELHHFCDASTQAYAAVSYLRIITNEKVHVSFCLESQD